MIKFSELQLDGLTEIINIGVGKGANVLNTMLDSHIQLNAPFLKIITLKELEDIMQIKEKGHKLAAVNLAFNGGISGNAQLIFPSESASHLVSIFAGDQLDMVNLNSLRSGALCEVGNVVLNSVIGSLGNLLKFHFNYSVPDYAEGTINNHLPFQEIIGGETVIILAKTRFIIQEFEIEGDIVLFLEVDSFDTLLNAIDNYISI